jgi:hypothetical protein
METHMKRGSALSVVAAFGTALTVAIGADVAQSQQYSALQCQQLLGQIREYQEKLPAYEAQGQGAMLRQGIAANQAEYNRGCHSAGGNTSSRRANTALGLSTPTEIPKIYVPPSRAGQFSGAGDRTRDEIDGMSLDDPPGTPAEQPTRRVYSGAAEAPDTDVNDPGAENVNRPIPAGSEPPADNSPAPIDNPPLSTQGEQQTTEQGGDEANVGSGASSLSPGDADFNNLSEFFDSVEHGNAAGASDASPAAGSEVSSADAKASEASLEDFPSANVVDDKGNIVGTSHVLTIHDGSQVKNADGSTDTYSKEDGKWYATNSTTGEKQPVQFFGYSSGESNKTGFSVCTGTCKTTVSEPGSGLGPPTVTPAINSWLPIQVLPAKGDKPSSWQ